MSKRYRIGTAAAVFALACGAAWAAPRSYDLPAPTAELRPARNGAHAPGFEAAQANCQTCHAPDYILTQPPGRGAAFWDGEVTKMVKVYRAPISDADAKLIAAYLADTY